MKKYLRMVRGLFFNHIKNHQIKYIFNIVQMLYGREFISMNATSYFTNKWVKTIPNEFDVIVGIPRHGLITATTAAMWLGLPLTTPDKMAKSEYWMTDKINHKIPDNPRILLIDDSIGSGESLEKAAKEIGKPNITIGYPFGNKNHINLKYPAIPPLFECNALIMEEGLTHESNSFHIGSDLDGVLARNIPTLRLNRGEDPRPYFIPKYKLAMIASGRTEDMRRRTEKWLDENGVKYDNLILRNSLKEDSTITKANAILDHNINLFWESEQNDSFKIFLMTGIPVLCFDNSYCYGVKNL